MSDFCLSTLMLLAYSYSKAPFLPLQWTDKKNKRIKTDKNMYKKILHPWVDYYSALPYKLEF